jgi:hypothetical protein
VRGTGREEAVYNCRVAEWHTYFVGCAAWGFSLWAHNSCGPTAGRNVTDPRVARVLSRLDQYPRVIDPRTGRHIPFPSDVRGVVPRAQRVTWDNFDRARYIAEWHRRGYPTPRSGWEHYDIHHIRPREYGGSNDFWNLVPVERNTHQLFNRFWEQFPGL